MICRWRGRILPSMSTGQLSSASLISVWLVYEKTWQVTSNASSQLNLCSSINRRISSGIDSTGWVSLR
ncbi:hypothetical protein D3C71_1441060 [compost metagenome]